MAAFEVIALDTATPQLRAPATGDTYSMPRLVAITPETLTGSAATSGLSVTQTWNTTGAPTALKLDITDTASNASSLLMDLRVGGSSKFSVTKAGYATFAAGSGTVPSIMVAGGGGNSGFGSANGYDYYYTRAGSPMAFFGFNRLDLGAGNLTWSSTVGGTADVLLTRDAANTLAQRNGVNAQEFRWSYSYTDASNRQNGALKTASDQIIIEAQTAGTGADNIDVTLTPAGTGAVRYGTHSAIAAETVTGYITIKDAGGTTRKLAVVS